MQVGNFLQEVYVKSVFFIIDFRVDLASQQALFVIAPVNFWQNVGYRLNQHPYSILMKRIAVEIKLNSVIAYRANNGFVTSGLNTLPSFVKRGQSKKSLCLEH